MISNIPLKCECGLLTGIIEAVDSQKRNRFTCLCEDCQTYALWLGHAKRILDEDGGTEITPVVPAKMKLLTGHENLKCVQLSAKGLHRWYAGCCRTPIANTPNAKVPYAGVVHSIIYVEGAARADMMGPLSARIQGKFGKQPLRKGTSLKTPASVMIWMMGFMIPAFLKKQNKPTPFYTEEGEPVAEPYVLAEKERVALRSQTGPDLKLN